MTADLPARVTSFLEGGRPPGWRREAVEVMKDIREGYLASYGEISDELKRRTGKRISPRTIGWLRRRLYEFFRSTSVALDERPIPLHRIATKGDTSSQDDSDTTKRENEKLRGAEGSLENCQSMGPSDW